jgi:hypothetical protein
MSIFGVLEPDLLSLLQTSHKQVNASPWNFSAFPPLDYSARFISLLVTPWYVWTCAAVSAAYLLANSRIVSFAADYRPLELYALAGLGRAARM